MNATVKENYEKILLASLLFLLTITSIVSIILVRDIPGVSTSGEGNDVKVEDVPKFEVAGTSIASLGDTKSLQSFVYCRNADCDYLIHKKFTRCNWCKTPLVHEEVIDGDLNKNGVLDKVELSWGISLDDPNGLYRDSDGDSFRNIDEYQLKTSVTDSSEYPALVYKAYFAGVSNNYIPLMVKDVIQKKDIRGNLRIYVDAMHTKRGAFYLGVGEETSWLKILDAGEKDGKKFAVFEYFGKKLHLTQGEFKQYEGWPKCVLHNSINEKEKIMASAGEFFELTGVDGRKEIYEMLEFSGKNKTALIKKAKEFQKFTVTESPSLKAPVK